MSSYFTVTIFFLLHLALVLLCQCNAHDVATKVDQKHVINRQLSASIASPTWPTTSTSPLCEAYAYIDSSTSATTKSSSPTFDFGEVTFYSEWKFNYLASITNTTLNSNSNIIDDANDLSSYEKGIQLALDKAQESYPNEKGYHDSLDSKLLAYSLATRAHSPQCEMYRILSRQALSHFNAIHKDNKDGIPSMVSLNAFVIIKGQITDYFTTVEQLIDLNKEQDTETKIMESSTDKISSYFGFSSSKKKENEKRQEYNNNNSTTEDSWASILPKEEIYNRSNKDVDKNHQHGKPIYILYGQFHTKEFASLFNYLNENNNSFVVRYMGYTNFEEEKSHTNEKEYQTTLQGYGVRVDIRNLEYKSFDEKETANSANVSSSSADDTNRKKQFDVEDTLNIDVIKDQWIDGIDPEILSSHALSPELQNFVKQYMPHLQSSNIDKFHLPIIPPRNELQDLSLAATTVIHQSVDPLWTMTQLSQNLPSHAYALCNVTIPDDLRIKTITKLNAIPIVQRSREDGIFQFYLNGRKMSVDRPSFNLFELLNVLREETSFVNQIYNVMKDYLPKQTKAMEIAVSLLSMGKDDFDKDEDEDHIGTESSNNDVLRIDVGRGYKGAILYLNDIEKDDDYAGWPSDVQHGLMNVQYGRPPTMRKNLLTILIVIDPFDSKGNFYIQILTFVFQLMQGMYPVRVGVLFASEQDINYCREKMSSDDMEKDQYCLKKRFNGDEDQALKQIATAQSLFALLLHVYQTHGGIIAINYIFGMLETLMTEDIKNINIDKIFQLHKQSLRMMRIPVSEDVSELMDQIRLGESNKAATTYEKAVKFAIKKNIKPGMAFVNGIPFSVDKPSDVNSIIQNEIQHLLGMIMEGKITNSKRSIYAKLLTGPNVYKQMHPLLTEENPQYRLTTSYFDDDTLISPKERIDSEPLILCEAVIDFGNEAGLKLAESFLQSMKRKVEITKGSNHVNLSFRLLPSDGSSAQSSLGKIFQQANKFGIDSLISITQAYQMVMLNGKESTGDALLSQMDNLPEKELIGKILGTSNECPELPWEKSAAGSISANGRVYFTASITTDDIEVLIDLAYKSAKTITNKLRNEMQYDKTAYIAIARLASFVSYTFANSKSSTIRRADPLVPFRDIISEQSSDNNMFFYSWNGKSTEAPKVTITVILDPISEATQRAAPLIKTLRDDFGLQIQLLLIPRDTITETSTLPITSYYRLVASSLSHNPTATFQGLPADQILTIRMDVPESWDVQQGGVIQDTDNLRCDEQSCSDKAYVATREANRNIESESKDIIHLTEVQYHLNSLLFFGQCYDVGDRSPPNGLQFTLSEALSSQSTTASGTLVMKTIGYWQLRSGPGLWKLKIAANTRGSKIYEMVEGDVNNDGTFDLVDQPAFEAKTLVMKDFVNPMEIVLVRRKEGFERAELIQKDDDKANSETDTIHVFSLATGHLYERFLKIMMLSVTKRASVKVKFWFLENFLSPSFKSSAFAMANKIGCEVEFITYKWPEWLRAQSEKQRIIWGYKILFLDVLFPLDLKKVIYVDADQVVRGDLKELMDLDLQGAPYGYTPMCESNKETKGYQFWRQGFWPNHLRGRPYHISALYVVDLQQFRKQLVGDQLRSVYQQLTSDPNNLSNLDQDLPNFTQNQIKIHSLPQDWLWCESWCSEDTKKAAKTIDLCNNPAHKEAKLSMAKRIISGDLFPESWIELDEEVAKYEEAHLRSVSN